MKFIAVLFMAFMVFGMFAVDFQFTKIREDIKDIKTLMELKKKYTEDEG
jgi:hypothetical protein